MLLIFKSRKRLDEDRVKSYLKTHQKATAYTLFATAYFLEYSLLDKYEVHSVVDRYTATGYVPSYVSRYLQLLN